MLKIFGVVLLAFGGVFLLLLRSFVQRPEIPRTVRVSQAIVLAVASVLNLAVGTWLLFLS